MAQQRSHEYIDGETIEVVPGDSFTSCHFVDCEFVGQGGSVFRRCTFYDTFVPAKSVCDECLFLQGIRVGL